MVFGRWRQTARREALRTIMPSAEDRAGGRTNHRANHDYPNKEAAVMKAEHKRCSQNGQLLCSNINTQSDKLNGNINKSRAFCSRSRL